jgi:hypothetical protein
MKLNPPNCRRSLSVLVGATALVCALPLDQARALVDFETIPGFGLPTELTIISNQYLASDGISFALAGGQLPILAQVGAPGIAFTTSAGPDTPLPGQNAGSFFLIDPDTATQSGPPPSDLLVNYSSPVMSASGVILDIDQAEAWLIQAFDAGHVPIGSITLDPSSFNAGDGLATAWSFTHGTADIAGVRIRYTGATPSAIGYAWDNFATSVPEPSTAALLVAGSLLVRSRCKARPAKR